MRGLDVRLTNGMRNPRYQPVCAGTVHVPHSCVHRISVDCFDCCRAINSPSVLDRHSYNVAHRKRRTRRWTQQNPVGVFWCIHRFIFRDSVSHLWRSAENFDGTPRNPPMLAWVRARASARACGVRSPPACKPPNVHRVCSYGDGCNSGDRRSIDATRSGNKDAEQSVREQSAPAVLSKFSW